MLRRKPLKIGLSARIFHPEAAASGIKTKTLQVLEQSVSHWVMSRDVMVLMIPSIVKDAKLFRSNIRLSDYADYLDGLVLQGGADVSPLAYGEEPLKPEWAGDPVRDAYEMELLHEFMEARKPVLGICRGMQIINVALGGTLYQDLPTQVESTTLHEAPEYDRHGHEIRIAPGGQFAKRFGETAGGRVISIHHQAVKKLANGLIMEAESVEDNVTEALSWTGRGFVVGVQWHPEFHYPNSDGLLDCTPILDAFLAAARG